MKRHCLSTMYGVGLIRIAPGTFGSAVAALLAYPILMLPQGYLWLTLGAGLFTLLGTANASRFMRDRHTTHDPQEIVIDELIGQWLTYSISLGWLWLMTDAHGASIPCSGGSLDQMDVTMVTDTCPVLEVPVEDRAEGEQPIWIRR